MTEKNSQSNQVPSLFLRLVLVTVLLASVIGVFFSVRWIYDRVQSSLSLELAEVVVAFLAIVILGLVAAGFGAGFGTKRALRTRKAHACKIYHSLKWCKVFQALWGYMGPTVESEQSPAPEKQDVPQITFLPKRASRRGRVSNYPVDRWIKVVLAWENRDTLRHPITLMEFLSEEFGTWADGSPRVAKKTFYDNQKKVHALLSEQEAGKSASRSLT